MARRALTLDDIDRMDKKDIEAWQNARRKELAEDAAKERAEREKEGARREFLKAGGSASDFKRVWERRKSERAAAAMEAAESAATAANRRRLGSVL